MKCATGFQITAGPRISELGDDDSSRESQLIELNKAVDTDAIRVFRRLHVLVQELDHQIEENIDQIRL